MSWQFGRLLNLTDSFQKGLRWEVGNGNNVHFWKDLWIGNSKQNSIETTQMKMSKLVILWTQMEIGTDRNQRRFYPLQKSQKL